MKKITNIQLEEPNTILCLFDNKEWRVLDLSSVINDKYANKILADVTLFRSVQIGEFGELYWANAAELFGLNGEAEHCNYDISPEFAYVHSKPVLRKVNDDWQYKH